MVNGRVAPKSFPSRAFRNEKLKEMRFAYPSQRFQDWLTQQWVIFFGQRIDPDRVRWLMGPFGNVDAIADDFIDRLAQDEQLIIERDVKSGGLVSSMLELESSLSDDARLNPIVVDFYENTTQYDLDLTIRWSVFFRLFGWLLRRIFSSRLEQLNLPLTPSEVSNGIQSEVVTLRDVGTGAKKYTIWYRELKSTGRVLYSGVYGTCCLPSGQVCIKVVFPLPRGNATVFMKPSVGQSGELHLTSAGRGFGDPGFYFLLNDSKGGHWAQYIRSFRERIDVFVGSDGQLRAEHTMTLWNCRVLTIQYQMHRRAPMAD